MAPFAASISLTSKLEGWNARRSFASKKKNKGGGDGGNKKPAVMLNMCYSSDDLEDEEVDKEDMIIFKKKPSMEELLEKLADYGLDEDGVLEFYNKDNMEWTPLTDVNQLRGMQGERVDIRMTGAFYDDEDLDDMDPYPYDDNKYDSSHDDDRVEEQIKMFVKKLKGEGLRPSADDPGQLKSGDGQVRPTREWILQLAEESNALQSLLLSKPGTLSHFVECLHYEFLWKEADKDGDAPDAEQIE